MAKMKHSRHLQKDSFNSKSGKKISVRQVETGDESILFDFAKEIESEDTYITLNPDEPITWEEEEKYVAGLLKKIEDKKAVHLLAFDGDKLVGGCGVEIEGKRQNHVGRLGITLVKDYRSDGIGKKLMELTIKKARRDVLVEQVVLDCLANNKVGRSLYEKSGFVVYGRQPKAMKFRGNLVDKLLFYKNLI
jgi:RimJ/RimL family protein N-acetyltransferase